MDYLLTFHVINVINKIMTQVQKYEQVDYMVTVDHYPDRYLDLNGLN